MKKFHAKTDGRPTVAFMTRDIDGVTGYTLFQSAVEAARSHNSNLVIFFGFQIGHSKYNSVYKFCHSGLFEGFLNWATSEEQDLVHYTAYKGQNLVSLTMKIPGHPYVTIDCYSGTKAAIKHLIDVHNRKKIAFVKGPQLHVYANERYQAYVDALGESGIPLDENLITPPGDYSFEAGELAVDCLTRQRRLSIPGDIDAIVTTNDRVLIGAIRELQKTGVKVPADLAALGLNSTVEGACFTPPLSSVAMPFHGQMETAFAALIGVMDLKPAPEKSALAAQMIVKKSCGCLPIEIEQAACSVDDSSKPSSKQPEDFEAFLEKAVEAILPLLASDEVLGTADSATEQALVKKIISAFYNAITLGTNDAFLASFEESLVFLAEHNANLQPWHNALNVMRNGFIKDDIFRKKPDPRRLVNAENLITQARIILSEVIQRKNTRDSYFMENARQLLQKCSMKLVSTFDLASLFKVLEEGVASLGVPSYYVCLYDRPVSYTFPDPLPESARLVFAIAPGIKIKDVEGKRFSTVSLLPDDMVDRQRRFDLVVIPLVFGDRHLGYTVAEIGPVTNNFYTVIADQLACALMGSLLLEERKKTESFLETTLENLQNKAGVVAKNSQAIMDRVSAVSTATEEIAANIRQISRETEEVMSAVHNATGRVNSTVEVIKSLREQSDRISQITGLINDIAEKTNILSLNANIQAARAGDAGRGFKVVADEIKKLSQITVDSTVEIKNIVSVIKDSGQETFDAVYGIIEVIGRINDLSTHIREAISQQSIATAEVADSLTETANGSKTIFEAIKEVAVAEEGGESDTAGGTISEQLRRFTRSS